ncbi:hypothetical protein [Aquimarina longa]|uniref:hypothetical protein n=1 Tax=Aquimarina longa TaxID=1080221 RepID=UPI000783D67F|nr:hypothetical protein [Aquimarina longa]
MNTRYINFKKKRELGDIITDTFAFLRQNGKALLSIVLKTSGIFFILLLLASAYYTHVYTIAFNPVNISSGEVFKSPGSFIIAVLALFTTLLIFYGVLSGTVLHYIKAYIDNKGVVEKEAVVKGVKKDFGTIIGLGVLCGLIVFFGTMLCFIPGIYLYVPMSLAFSILVFRSSSISDAISESFQLIKNEWWITFATLFIIGLLIWLISLVFSLPAVIYSYSNLLTSASEQTMTNTNKVDWIFIALNTISSSAQYLLYIITTISTAFIYFNLNERKHNTGTLEEIDSLSGNHKIN